MPGPGRSDDAMAEMRALRDPSDPRDGRLCHQIRMAFWAFEGIGNWKPEAASNRTGRFPASGSRTRAHAFAHGTLCPSAVRRTSPKCP